MTGPTSGAHWTLNGTYLSPFEGLPPESIAKLKHTGTYYGVEVFTAEDMPEGTLEMWQDGVRVAVIEGIGETK